MYLISWLHTVIDIRENSDVKVHKNMNFYNLDIPVYGELTPCLLQNVVLIEQWQFYNTLEILTAGN